MINVVDTISFNSSIQFTYSIISNSKRLLSFDSNLIPLIYPYMNIELYYVYEKSIKIEKVTIFNVAADNFGIYNVTPLKSCRNKSS